jgi:hypothetical protein
MPLFGSRRKKTCKFCGENAQYIKEYDDYFCPHCKLFQYEEDKLIETKILPELKLKKYNFIPQKYHYYIFDQLETKIARCERRNLSNYVTDKEQFFRYLFFNQLNRIILSISSSTQLTFSDQDSLWKVYDYGHNYRGQVKHLIKSDTWQILDPSDEIIALRDPKDSRTKYQAARYFTILDSESKEELFTVQRKHGFELAMTLDSFDPHLAWCFVIAIHRSYYT